METEARYLELTLSRSTAAATLGALRMVLEDTLTGERFTAVGDHDLAGDVLVQWATLTMPQHLQLLKGVGPGHPQGAALVQRQGSRPDIRRTAGLPQVKAVLFLVGVQIVEVLNKHRNLKGLVALRLK
jgi:hypothetical protein